MPQQPYDILHIWIIVQHPSRCYRAVVGRIYQRKRVCKLAGVFTYKHTDVGIPAYFAVVNVGYQSGQSIVHILCANHFEKSVKLLPAFQQRSEHQAFAFRQRVPAFDFIHQQVFSLLAIVDGIVHLFAHQLVVLHKSVVRTLGKQQRRHVKRIHHHPTALSRAEQVLRVMVYYVVTADIVHPLDKLEQPLL